VSTRRARKSDEHFTTEAWSRFSGPHENGSLSYDFKLIPGEKKTRHRDDYI
jgi:hypothetical protein